MADIIKIKKGTKAQLPDLQVGEMGYAYDSNEVYIGSYEGNKIPNQNKFDEINEQLTESAKRTVSINTPSATSGVFDFANFAGQGTVNPPIGGVIHDYTDSFATVQIDNVGEGASILVLKNARNPIRRGDKPNDYVGSSSFLTLYRSIMEGETETSKYVLNVDKNAQMEWALNTAKFVVSKLDDASWGYSVTALNEHDNFITLKNGNVSFLNVTSVDGTNKINIDSTDALHATEMHWKKTTGKLLQDKVDDGNWAFAIQTINPHANVLNVQSGSSSIFSVYNDKINLDAMAKLKTISTPPTPTKGAIYFDGVNFKACKDGTTWQTIQLV